MDRAALFADLADISVGAVIRGVIGGSIGPFELRRWLAVGAAGTGPLVGGLLPDVCCEVATGIKRYLDQIALVR